MSLNGLMGHRYLVEVNPSTERRMSKQRLPIIRASEVGEYVYCARAWWLRRVEGLEPDARERLERGMILHRRHGLNVAGSRILLGVAVLLVFVAFVLLLVGR